MKRTARIRPTVSKGKNIGEEDVGDASDPTVEVTAGLAPEVADGGSIHCYQIAVA